jgi:signal transduction histidine kinase
VNGPTRHLRTRLLVAMVAVAFGVLVVAALGAAGIARETSADSAEHDLEKQAPTVSKELERLGPLFRRALAVNRNPAAVARACQLLASTLRISGGGVVSITADGTIEDGLQGLLGAECTDRADVSPLPPGVAIDDLDVDKLRGGVTTTDVKGGTAFVAQPLHRIGAIQPVLVLTQDVETRPLGRAGPFLLGTGTLALIMATLVSFWLARRLTRPIAAVQTTAERIAEGDLSARVGEVSGPNDELASLAHSIDVMADELESARGHERAFLLSVSHDLRTPLTSIQGYAEAIADGTADSPEQRVRAASVIAAESRRLERLVADLLDLARLDAHQFSLRPVELDARAVVDGAVEGFAPAAAEWGVQLRVREGQPMTAKVDPERLGQIVANLVENALKYAASVVVVELVRTDGDGSVGPTIELRVDDDGPGIAAEERARVFERLYTSRDAPGRKVGTGIGLAIVYELAGAMGGTARCEPLDPTGSRFVVTLPA